MVIEDNDAQFKLAWLDEIIKKYIEHFKDKIDDKAKIGDLFKMIELRRKLSPENSEQKKFWKMLNKIRKDNLQKNENKKSKTTIQENDE